MTRLLRAAMTETCNVYEPMPASVDALDGLRGHLEELREANLEHHARLIASAAKAGAQVIGLGELFAGPYFALSRHPMWMDLAEDALDGPSVTRLRAVARAEEVIIVAPIYELCAQSGKRFNTAVVIDESGDVLGKYRKTHIPGGSNEQGSFYETDYYEASDGELGDWPSNVSELPHFPVFETRHGKLGVAICYDRHFEGVMSALASQGAELVFSPAVTFGAESRRLWPAEFTVDAARHRLFIAGSNRRGAEPPWQQEFFGSSHFAGPEGVVTPIDSSAELIIADLDLDQLSKGASSGWKLQADARPSIYRKS